MIYQVYVVTYEMWRDVNKQEYDAWPDSQRRKVLEVNEDAVKFDVKSCLPIPNKVVQFNSNLNVPKGKTMYFS